MGGCLFCKSHQLGAWGSGEGEGDTVGNAMMLCSERRKHSPGEGISKPSPLLQGGDVPVLPLGRDKDIVTVWEEERVC